MASLPSLLMKRGDGVLGPKPSQPVRSRINNTASQSEHGDFLVVEAANALELKLHLALLCALADQAHQPSGQMPDQKQNLKPLARTRARSAQTKPAPLVLDVAERLLDAHSLGVQSNNRLRAEMCKPRRTGQQPWFARTAGGLERGAGESAFAHASTAASPFGFAFDQHQAAIG